RRAFNEAARTPLEVADLLDVQQQAGPYAGDIQRPLAAHAVALARRDVQVGTRPQAVTTDHLRRPAIAQGVDRAGHRRQRHVAGPGDGGVNGLHTRSDAHQAQAGGCDLDRGTLVARTGVLDAQHFLRAAAQPQDRLHGVLAEQQAVAAVVQFVERPAVEAAAAVRLDGLAGGRDLFAEDRVVSRIGDGLDAPFDVGRRGEVFRRHYLSQL